MKIVVTGSIAYDYLMFFPGKFTDHLLPEHLHHVNLSFLVDSMKRERGGNAPNIGYTLGLLAGRPVIMATAGQDFGEYRNWLERHGVDTSGIVEIDEEYCASFFVSTDENQNQIASFYTGAMAYAHQLNFARYAPDAELAIISPNDPSAMRNHVRECKQLQIPYIYDPSQQTVRLTAEDLREGVEGCFLLTANDYEFQLIQEKAGYTQKDILRLAGGLVVTHGKNGSTIYVGGQVYNIPAVNPKQVVEPTGTGDGYRAGLMRGIQMGFPWQVCGQMGALAATYVIENMGTQNHRYTPTEFVNRYEAYFGREAVLSGLLGS